MARRARGALLTPGLAAVWVVCVASAASDDVAPAEPASPPSSESTLAEPVVAPEAPASAATDTFRPQRRPRITEEIDRCTGASSLVDPACPRPERPTAGGAAAAPPGLGERNAWLAAGLGAGLGFGSGFFYAGDTRQGIAFGAVDAALWAGLGGVVLTLNQLVVRNDLRSGRSLVRGERPLGEREQNLVIANWALGAMLIASHVYQGVAGLFAAWRSNDALQKVIIVPVGAGASVLARW